MSEAKHTSGPWRLSMEHCDEEGYIAVSAKGHAALAQVVWQMKRDQEDGGNSPECEANARLIAAAPEMLEALVACRAELVAMIQRHNYQDEHDGSWMYDCQTIGEADTAIAKATGSES